MNILGSLTLQGLVFLPCLLQIIGLFTPWWVSNSNCDKVGLVYSCCSGANNKTCENTKGGDELDVRALGLEVTSLALMLFAQVLAVWCIWFESGKTLRVIGGCALLYLIAGLFTFIGCMIVASDYPTSQQGWSFDVCVASAGFIYTIAIILCFGACKK